MLVLVVIFLLLLFLSTTIITNTPTITITTFTTITTPTYEMNLQHFDHKCVAASRDPSNVTNVATTLET